MESATVHPPAAGYAGLATRVRALPADAIAVWAFVGLAIAAFVGFLLRVTYPNYDSYYSLIWGREILHGHLPTFKAYNAPTEHPLAVAFGALLSVFGHTGDRLFVLLTLMSLVALAAGIYKLARSCFNPVVGALAAFLILTRFDFPSLAVRGYIDIPFLAVVVWAAALEAARPRRGLPVFLLLAAAGLMRPEAWLLSGLYFLYMSWNASWEERFRYAVLTAIAPFGWMVTDAIVTGNPLFSLTSTKDLAAALQRQKSGSGALAALPADLQDFTKPPVYFTGLIGMVIAVWRYPQRSAIPFILFCAGVFTFVATGTAGLSVIVRYLLIPVLMLSLFAAFAIGGFTTLKPGSLGRRVWSAGSGVALLFALVWTVAHPPSLNQFDSELAFRGESGRSLYAVLGSPVVHRYLRCGPLSLPTHRLIPDSRWILDLPQHRVVSRSQNSATARKRSRYGVALIPTSRLNVVRNAFTDTAKAWVVLPPAGFKRIAVGRFYAAYARCPQSRQ